jgi:hypothetical protein
MTVIITGGSGLVGRALTASLTTDGHEVIILSRSPEKVTQLPNQAQAEGWDGRSPQGWGHLANEAEAIVNLAGASLADSRWTDARKKQLLDSRVLPGQAVTQAVEAATNRPRVVIQASAVGYYGPGGDEEIDETASPGNDFLAKLCLDWEAATAPIAGMGVRLATMRTGVVLSMKGGALPKQSLPFKMFVGGPVGSGKQWYPWIHIDDAVAGIRFLIETELAAGPINLTAPNPVTNAQFGRTIGKVMGRPAFMPAPAFAMKLLFGEMSTVLLDGQRVIPKALQDLGFTFKFPDVESALRDLLK